jgi:iron complex outermembrane receptor protein
MFGGRMNTLFYLMTGTALSMGTALQAQTQADPAGTDEAAVDEDRLEDVIVTAQRREERLQNVPVSVTALTGAQLDRQQISEVQDLAASVPNVWIGQGIGDPTDLVIGLRGFSFPLSQLVVDPSVGVYIDGVYISRTTGANVGLVDVERVEVLRGPQGTLFGRNTIGGAVNIITRRPANELQASLVAGIGNFDRRELTGVVNVPVGGGGVRLVYQHSEHSGYHRNAFLNRRLDSENQNYLRGSLSLPLGSAVNVDLVADVLKSTGRSQFQVMTYFNPANAFNASLPAANGRPNDRLSNYVNTDLDENYGQTDAGFRAEGYSAVGTIEANLGSVTLKSITGYRNYKAERPSDMDGTPYVLIEFFTKPFFYDQFSQELQAYGDLLNDRLSWIAGLYYFKESGGQGQNLSTRQPISLNVSLANYTAWNKNIGAFAQGTFHVVPDRLRVTAGLRYTEDSRRTTYLDQTLNLGTNVTTCAVPVAVRNSPTVCAAQTPVGKFSYWPWTASIEYTPSDTALFYAKIAKGYRSGGFPQSITDPLQIAPFGPEDVLSPEAGAKLDLFGRRLRFNVAGFYSEYKNIQQSLTGTGASGAPAQFTRNVGSGRIYGAEIEATAKLNQLLLNAALGLVHPKFTSGPFVGTPFQNVSKRTLHLGAEYGFVLPFGSLSVGGDYVYQSAYWLANPVPSTFVDAAAVNEAFRQDGVGLFNARAVIGWGEGSPTSLTFWIKNISNERYKTRAQDFVRNGFGFVNATVGDPRTFGADLRFSF